MIAPPTWISWRQPGGTSTVRHSRQPLLSLSSTRNGRSMPTQSAAEPSRCSEISGRRPMKKPRFCQMYSLFKVVLLMMRNGNLALSVIPDMRRSRHSLKRLDTRRCGYDGFKGLANVLNS